MTNGTEQRGDIRLPARYDRTAVTRSIRLRLARDLKNAGAIYQALHAYTEIMARYPGTDTARDAAVELAALAETLEQQGKVRTALHIFDTLEQLL
jgi:flagellar biosynthesis/type III secretory pathway ATPase